MKKCEVNYFNKPYPYDGRLKPRILIILGFGIFVPIFLFVLTPFGLGEIVLENKNLIMLGYSPIVMFAMSISDLLIPTVFSNYYREDRWTVKNEYIHVGCTLLSVMTFNYFYSIFVYPDIETNGEYWLGAASVLVSTVVVGAFPVSIMIMVKMNKNTKKYLLQAQKANEKLETLEQQFNNPDDLIINETLELVSVSGKSRLMLAKQNLICIEANENYAAVYYKKDNEIKKELLRTTLKNIENQLNSHGNIKRCHKSYIVNLNIHSHVSGNAQGCKIHFEGLDFQIPVSRTKSKEILNLDK